MPKGIELTVGELQEELSKKYRHKYSFLVRFNQSVHDVVNREEHRTKLPDGACEIILFNPATNLFVFGKNPRRTGGRGEQNIFTFFNNTGGTEYKWKQIQDEMKSMRIAGIIVTVFFN